MKKISLAFVFCLSSYILFAQNNITGRLSDDSGQPVSFANVVLKTIANDSLITGTITGEDGFFSLVCKEGTYNLVASYVGYERLAVRCSAGDDLGTLTMNAKQLETVTITASRTTESVDRFVVMPKQEEVQAAGRTLVLLDMLGLPGLKVDVALQSITVDGGLAILQINGKEVPVARLANLKAEQIKRVEYSNNPGTRYLDRGASGIVNIILKEREDGGSIVAKAESALTTGFVNGYLLGSYHKGKSEFALEYTLGYRNYDSVPYELEDSYLDAARTVTRSQHTNMPFWYIQHTLNAEYTYQHDDSTMFVASVQDDFFTKTLDATGTMTETDNGTTTYQSMLQHNYSTENLPKLDLFYTHKMPHGQKVELNVVGEYATDRYDNTLTYTGGTYATSIDGHGYALSGEGVYSKQFDKVELRTGLQYQHNFAENEYTLYGVKTAMAKDNAYLYAEMQGMLGQKVGYSIGTGAKLLNVTDGTSDQHYIRNLSTARLQWHISPQWSLTASSQFTPTLPSLSALSPVALRPPQRMVCHCYCGSKSPLQPHLFHLQLRPLSQPLRSHLAERRPMAMPLCQRPGRSAGALEMPQSVNQWDVSPLQLRGCWFLSHQRQFHRRRQCPVLLEEPSGWGELHASATMDTLRRGLHGGRDGTEYLRPVPLEESHGHAHVALPLQSQRLPLRDRRPQRRASLQPHPLDRQQRQYARPRPHLADRLRSPVPQRREDAQQWWLRQRHGQIITHKWKYPEHSYETKKYKRF